MIQGSNLPRPTVGMIAPVLSVTEVVAGILTNVVVGTIGESKVLQHRVFIVFLMTLNITVIYTGIRI